MMQDILGDLVMFGRAGDCDRNNRSGMVFSEEGDEWF